MEEPTASYPLEADTAEPLLSPHPGEEADRLTPQDSDSLQSGSRPVPGLSLAQEFLEMAGIAAPTAISNLLEFLPVVTAAAMVGNMPGKAGKEGLDATSLGRAYFNITANAPVFGMLGALRTLCPQAVGSGKPELLGVYVQQSLIVILLLSVPCTALQFVAADVLTAMGESRELSLLAQQFCICLIPQYFGLAIMTTLQRVYQAHKMVWSNLAVCALGCALAPPLQTLFINHMCLGFKGAAYASSLYTCSFMIFQIIYLGHVGMLGILRPQLKEALSREQVANFLSLSMPSLVQTYLEWAAIEIVVFLSGLLHPPDTALAAASLTSILMDLMLMCWIGLLVAVSVSVGRYVGAGDVTSAKRAAIAGGVAGSLLGLMAGGITFTERQRIVSSFTQDPGVQQLGMSVYQVLAVMVLFDAISNFLGGVMCGLGLQRALAICQLVGYYGLGLPLGVALAYTVFDFGEKGVIALWGGSALAMLSSVVLQSIVLARHSWDESVQEAKERMQVSASQYDLLQYCRASFDEDGGLAVPQTTATTTI